MNTDESLSKIFDLEPMPKAEVIVAEPVESSTIETSEKIEGDYDKTRENLHSLLVKGQEALEAALTVAKQSEHPRAFEVVGNLMKQLADVNQQLMDLHQQKRKLEEPSKTQASKQVTNNSIFVGSTADLNKMIKKLQGE
jgi:hypothetical protein